MAEKAKMERKLTINQEKFAQEYVLTGNSAGAYRTAYPKSLKWKDNSVYRESSILLTNPKVSQRVKELQERVLDKFDISAERLLLEQSRIALFDFRKLFTEDGRLISPVDMPDEVAAVVSSVKVSRVRRSPDDETEEDIVELKLWNKNNSIDSLFKHKGLYEKDNTQSTPQFNLTISPLDAKI